MSAYMCGVEHWSVLAERIARYDQRTAPQLFDLLANENKVSIDYRYARGIEGDPDYMYDHTDPFEGGYRVPADLLWSDDEYVLIAECYNYQACEHPDYHNSEACLIIRDLLARVCQGPSEPVIQRCKAARDTEGLGFLWNVGESSISRASWKIAVAELEEASRVTHIRD